MKQSTRITAKLAMASLGACISLAYAQVPDAVKVPAGNKEVAKLKGAGMLAYECKAKDAAFEWTFAGPDAVLTDASGKSVGKYYGGPTWEHMDGSKVTGKQLAVAPASAGNIPFQLVEAAAATGKGMMQGVTYIQRVNTQGGVAPKDPCGKEQAGQKKTVGYSADYVFFKK